MARASAQDLAADSMVNLNQARTGCDFQIRVLAGPECERLRSLGFCEKMRVRKLMGADSHAKYFELKQMAAHRCPRELGKRIKRSELMFHHEVTNQMLWNRF